MAVRAQAGQLEGALHRRAAGCGQQARQVVERRRRLLGRAVGVEQAPMIVVLGTARRLVGVEKLVQERRLRARGKRIEQRVDRQLGLRCLVDAECAEPGIGGVAGLRNHERPVRAQWRRARDRAQHAPENARLRRVVRVDVRHVEIARGGRESAISRGVVIADAQVGYRHPRQRRVRPDRAEQLLLKRCRPAQSPVPRERQRLQVDLVGTLDRPHRPRRRRHQAIQARHERGHRGRAARRHFRRHEKIELYARGGQ